MPRTYDALAGVIHIVAPSCSVENRAFKIFHAFEMHLQLRGQLSGL